MVCDWRAHGSFQFKVGRKADFGYHQMVEDVKEIIDVGDQLFAGTRRVLMGHSLGGQVSALLIGRLNNHFDGLVMLASGSIYHKGWSGLDWLGVRFITYAFPVIANLVGYFPGKYVAFAGKEARSVINDWGRCGRTGEFRLVGTDFDYDNGMKTATPPVLAITVEGDVFATPNSSKQLIQKFSSKDVEMVHLASKQENIDKSLDHFNWAKYPQTVLPHIEAWMIQRKLVVN
ncbi:hypothetical protein GCM10007894_15280 [Paraferrimonas haliotis]|uniref:Serine aminopeptidase S33 domain-containing protein n=1 Tax=Paraferrimonas haliotis TaxID=2013866 RepID=A0AA37TS31_9GAMM|nr:hypothetical protein GCM10007894_15280 [Paraferrimonas haliotis]